VRVLAADTLTALEGARLHLRPTNDLLRRGTATVTATTDARGEVTFPDLPGDVREGWSLRIEREGYSTRILPVGFPPGGAQMLEIPLEPEEGLLLEVRGPLGEPVTQVQASVLDDRGRSMIYGSFSAGADGRVEIPGVGAGSWWLVVSGNSGLARQAITVPGPPISVPLRPTGQLRVSITDLRENPARARMQLVAGDGRPLELLDRQGRVTALRYLRHGAATVDQVPEGSWQLRVEAADGRIWERRISVPAGILTEVEW
jgi:hypothetical protein